jgi:hypothetical protein
MPLHAKNLGPSGLARFRSLAIVAAYLLAGCDPSGLAGPRSNALSADEQRVVGGYGLVSFNDETVPRESHLFAKSASLSGWFVIDSLLGGELTLLADRTYHISWSEYGRPTTSASTYGDAVYRIGIEETGHWQLKSGTLQLGTDRGCFFPCTPTIHWTSVLVSNAGFTAGTILTYQAYNWSVFKRR